jgi:hypothetical protein
MNVKKGMSKRLKIILIVFVILILLIGGYFLIKKINISTQKKEMTAFEQGFTYGYTNAVMQIINVSETCQPFPVYLGNQTTTLISVDCLNRQIS